MREVHLFLEKELKRGTFPGGVLGIFTSDRVYYREAFGLSQLEPEQYSTSLETLFDLASLTKVIATTTSILILLERGEISIHESIKTFFPGVGVDKEEITLFHLLTHTSGLPAIVQLFDRVLTNEEKIAYLLDLPLHYKIGSAVLYSDPNFILLGNLIERVSGWDLNRFTQEEIFRPLGMDRTTFNPRERFKELKDEEYAATEWCRWRRSLTPGEVHDKNAYYLGGVSGHAGLFAPLEDLIVFGQMLLQGGTYQGVEILTPRTVELMRTDWTNTLGSHRGYGWDLITNQPSSGGSLFSSKAFGHTGFTGTSIWLDPVLSLGVVFLTNRVHPTRENRKIISCRPKLHTLICSLWRRMKRERRKRS